VPRESDPDFLKQKAAEARRAITRSTGRAAVTAKKLLSARPWTDEYPLATVGVTGAFGFLVGVSAGNIGRARVPLECPPSPPPRKRTLLTLSQVLVLGGLRRLWSKLLPTQGSEPTGPTRTETGGE
jgi:hypothetical protein